MSGYRHIGHHPLLDGYRGAAVVAVVLVHAAGAAGATGRPTLLSCAFSVAGHLGLAVFFTLSGFLLYEPFLVRQREGAPRPALGTFASRRLLRIFPAWWALLAIAWAWPGVGRTFSIDWLPAWGIVQHFGADTTARAVAHSWSLTAELTFYLALPALAWLGSWSGRRFAGSIVVVASMVAVSLAMSTSAGADGALPEWVRRTAPAVGIHFALGMALAVVVVARGRDEPGGLIGWAAHRPLVAWTVAAVAIGVLLADGDLYAAGTSPSEMLRRRLFEAIAAAALLVPGIFGVSLGGAARRFLGGPTITWFGQRSYSLYLWHYPISLWVGGVPGVLPTAPFDVRVQDHLPGPDVLVVFAATLALATPIAALSYRFVEQPFMRHRSGPRRSAPATPTMEVAGT